MLSTPRLSRPIAHRRRYPPRHLVLSEMVGEVGIEPTAPDGSSFTDCGAHHLPNSPMKGTVGGSRTHMVHWTPGPEPGAYAIPPRPHEMVTGEGVEPSSRWV